MFELLSNTLKTSENFLMLCTGQSHKHSRNGELLHYKRSRLHTVEPGIGVYGGIFVLKLLGESTHGKGTGSESTYGSTFPDENVLNKHTGRGTLSMQNEGPDTLG